MKIMRCEVAEDEKEEMKAETEYKGFNNINNYFIFVTLDPLHHHIYLHQPSLSPFT